jgi:hypothetical protein
MIDMAVRRAIRAHCVDCSGGSHREVQICPINDCPLYPYRIAQISTEGRGVRRGVGTPRRSTKIRKSPGGNLRVKRVAGHPTSDPGPKMAPDEATILDEAREWGG